MPNVACDVHLNGWPADEQFSDGADCIVMYCDGGAGHMVNKHLDEVDALAKKGVGIVCIHYGVEVPKGESGDKFLEWIGGYFETELVGESALDCEIRQVPGSSDTPRRAAVRNQRRVVLPHAVSRGDAGRDADSRRAAAGRIAQPARWPAQRQPGRAQGCARGEKAASDGLGSATGTGGGRGFGFTGGHDHWNWGDPNFRKLVLNAIVWCAHGEVPASGVESPDRHDETARSEHGSEKQAGQFRS